MALGGKEMTKRAKPEELLGKRRRELRKKKGLTQEELYKYLGSIERGLENPSFRHLSRIARALGVELSELFQFHHLEPSRGRLLREINQTLS